MHDFKTYLLNLKVPQWLQFTLKATLVNNLYEEIY